MQSDPISAQSVPLPERNTNYPEPFASRVQGRDKRKLGNVFGLTNFGVNHTRLAPGAVSSVLHHHAKQDEFVYILEGTPTMILGEREFLMQPGDCCGFKAGTGLAHQLSNRSDKDVIYLEIGDRAAGDTVAYPFDDLAARQTATGGWAFTHKDGTPY